MNFGTGIVYVLKTKVLASVTKSRYTIKQLFCRLLLLICFKVSLSDKVGRCVLEPAGEDSANSVTWKRNWRRWAGWWGGWLGLQLGWMLWARVSWRSFRKKSSSSALGWVFLPQSVPCPVSAQVFVQLCVNWGGVNPVENRPKKKKKKGAVFVSDSSLGWCAVLLHKQQSRERSGDK